MPPSKPKPSEVAAETKRRYIPYVQQHYHGTWTAESYMVSHPLLEVSWLASPGQLSLTPPEFCEFTMLSSSLQVP